MEQSTSIENLAKALSLFQGQMGNVIFDSNNPYFKSKYASLSAIVNTAKPLLVKYNLAVSQLVGGTGSVTTILMHTSGEWIKDTVTLEPVKKDPQGYGSSITYARRYAYASILGIVSDDDDDGNHATDLHNKNEAIPYRKYAETIKIEQPVEMPVTFNVEDVPLNEEQGKGLLTYIKAQGYTSQDLKEMIFFDLNLKELKDIKVKHLIQIRKAFAKKKEVSNG